MNSKIFPSDFFEPILPKQKDNNSSSKNSTRGPKSIYVSLQKEYDEDKELLDLLSSKRKFIKYLISKFSLYSKH